MSRQIDVGSNWDVLGEVERCTATLCRLDMNGRTVLLTNVHLGWRSIVSKERQIRRIVDWSLSHAADLYFLCGDRNSAEESSVIAYLSGYRSLMESETTWINLVRAYESQTGWRSGPTLDFQNNARWTVGPATSEIPATVDWIFYRSNDFRSRRHIVEVKGAGLFGTDIGDTYHPSDHFGL